MKKRILSLLLALCMLLGLLPLGTLTAQAASLIEISTLAELKAFREEVNNATVDHSKDLIELTADIDLGGRNDPWTPIGTESNPFKGIFDGCGHRITGLYISDNTADYQGLFGHIEGGTVRNLGVAGTVTAKGISGGVVGSNNGTVTNCYYSGTFQGKGNTVGGVVGFNKGSVAGCYNTGTVRGNTYVGGIVGNCSDSGTVTNCYNTGTVSGSTAGGVVGLGSGAITNCYNTGTVTASGNYIGGVVGQSSTTTGCYFLADTAATGVGRGDSVAESKTAEEFAVPSTFSGWDFDRVWEMSAALGRPILTANPEPEPHLHPVCGATCSHDGEHESMTFDKALSGDSEGNLYIDGVKQTYTSLKTGNYYLTGDITLGNQIITVGESSTKPAAVNLCLNGHTMTLAKTTAGNSSYIYVRKGSTLNICACQGGGVTATGCAMPLLSGDKSCVVGLYGGKLTAVDSQSCIHNIGGDGGTYTVDGAALVSAGTAVRVGSASVVTVQSGTIEGNVGIQVDTAGTVNLSGAPKITGSESAFFLTLGTKLNVTGPLKGQYTVGLAYDLQEGSPAAITAAANADYSAHFTSAKDGYAIRNTGTGAEQVVELYKLHVHTIQTGKDWTYDDTNHWRQCTAEDCPDVDGSKADTAAHTKTYDKDAGQHWEKCSVCGWTGTKAAHSGGAATCTAKAVCSACGQSYGELAAHTWGAWTFQADGAQVTRTCTVNASHTESKDLSVTLDKTSYVYSGGENKPSVTVKAGDTALTPDTDYTVSYKNNVNKGTATVTVTGKGGYAGSVEKTFTITAKSLTATAATAASRAYDGTASVAVTAVTLEGVVDGDDVTVDTAGLKGTVSSPNASETPYETVTLQDLTLTGDKAGNYALAQVNATLPTSVTISKATPPTPTPGSFNIANSLEKKYNYLLSLLCPQLNQPSVTENRKDWGERSYSIESVEFTQDGYYTDGTAYIDLAEENAQYVNRLYLPILFNAAAHTGQVGTVTVKISSANYADFTNTVKIMASNKTAVTFEGVATPDKVYDGKPYACEGTLAVKAGDVYVTGADVEIIYAGRGDTGYSERETPPTNAGEFAMIVRIADADEHYIGRRSYNFTIRKASGEGSVAMANYAHGGTAGVPVPASATNGVDGVSYAYKVKGAPDETYAAAKPTAAGEYTVRATFPATLNYTEATATADFTISHAWADGWSYDTSHHWHNCTADGCTVSGNAEKDGYGEHVYDNDQDAACNTCGYTRAVTPPSPDQGMAKGEVEVKPGTPAVSVDEETLKGLAGTPAKGETVTVKLTVEKQDQPADKAALDEVIQGKKDDVLYLDLSLIKQINDQTPQAITDTGDKVLEIAVPYDFTGKKDVTVYRKHGSDPAQSLTKANDRTDGTYRLDEADGVVYIYASKFSTYAIGYAAEASTPSYSSGVTNTYKPTVQQPEHGKITVSPAAPKKGDTVTITVTPEDGYELDTITVTDRSGKTVPLTQNPDGTYSYTQPGGRVTISAVMKEAAATPAVCPRDNTCPVARFADADVTAWYHDGVHYCVEKGLMQGVSETAFAPAMDTSRAMITTILWRLAGSPEAKQAIAYPDCEANSWYAKAVAWAGEAGVVKGYGSGSFGPNAPITREQLAVMLWRYTQAKGQDVSVGEDTNILSYTDFAEISEWAVEALQWAVGSGVMNGKTGGRLDPQGLASRAEAAAMLQRFCARQK